MMTIKDITACNLCGSEKIRIHELKNIKSKNTPVLKENNIFCVTCSQCDRMYFIEESCDYVSVYLVSEHLRGCTKEYYDKTGNIL